MKGSAVKKTSARVMGSLILTTLLSFFTLTSCAEIKLGTIPTPPPNPKLRIFVKAISGGSPSRGWKMPHQKYEFSTYRRVQKILAQKGIYDTVSYNEVQQILGKKEFMVWQWEKNDWDMAIKAGKKLYAEYALIVERVCADSSYQKFVLINVNTKKVFESLLLFSKREGVGSWKRAHQTSINRLFLSANEDLLATASRKGQIASKELAQTKKEIQELIEAQKRTGRP